MNLKTRLRSVAMRVLSSEKFLERARNKARKQRRRSGDPPRVEYFHQVDDPYSHLAVQKLDALRARYPIEWRVHLIQAAGAEYLGSANHYAAWARDDAAAVAGDYRVNFEPQIAAPGADAVNAANAALSLHLMSDDFAAQAFSLGEALWRGAPITATADTPVVVRGSQRQRELGHYQGAMFYFEGEWFWGVDRLRSLERRLRAEGHAATGDDLVVPQPTPTDTTSLDTSGITLEYFPSLRSPYTAIGHRRVLELIKRSGVNLVVRPVMPMMMRGIPAPRAKQRYIITDAAREGREFGSPLGKVVDPFGPPVTRAFAQYAAIENTHQLDYVTAYLQAAWVDGVDITSRNGLRQVATAAGLDALQVEQRSANLDWQTPLQQNLELMLAHNLWGVPSFRVTGGNKSTPYSCWGQDRIWRVEQEIAGRA